MNNLTTVILVAGKSTRFKSSKSKIFHELGGLPIIDHVYLAVKNISKEIIFVCNKQNVNILKKKFLNCKFVIQAKQHGTADAVLSAKKLINDNSNILVLFGDVPLISSTILRRMINNYLKNKKAGSMIAFNSSQPFGYGRVLIKNNKVESVIEEISANLETKKITTCNSGIMLCKYSVLFSFIKQINNKNFKKEKYLTDIFKIANKNKKGFSYIFCKQEDVLGVNNLNDFNKVDKIYQRNLINKMIAKGVKILNPDTIRLSFDTKIGNDVEIEPFVYIKKGVKIDDKTTIKSHTVLESSKIGKESTVGPFARLRPNTTLGTNVKVGNYVEIKNSIIGNNTSISHLSYIGDSVVGKNVNIGAGTITCNYDGKNKNKTIIQDNVFVGSNSSLIAPLIIKKNSKIGAGSVITKDVPPNSLAVERSKLVFSRKNSNK
ncbi:MAG: Bifunctional protein GlmU [Alphaproteobacteria bacterium MarineAlpha5_Bin6]|nr:MAG: Bifunctional protein GlmU [Alphaproteobacteria bacterium MarineAlpha5_Bin7]PPR53989.1 MAG: Bifunctional protein GlmU [Alphaproteobacteria bacterium MarineAlpha5_Bin6]|tara:strand:+ start:5059 stop:6357 length:1299 start_codon:yes stop_codon:yes gene_type:complete